MDSACSDKSAIASRVLQLHTPSMRPCTRLQNANFSSTILESFAGSLTFLAFPKADSNPKILESKSSENHKTRRSRSFFSKSTASDFNLESSFLSSLRADNGGAAIHKNKAQKVDSSSTILQSHIAPQIQLECEKLAQLLESIFSSQADSLLSSRDFRKEVVAIHKSAKVDSSVKMDCHAIATALARNDRVGRVDCHADFQSTRNDRENAAILNEQPKDSRFCDEKPLLCKPRKEIRLAVYRHSAAQQSKVYRAKPNPPAKFN